MLLTIDDLLFHSQDSKKRTWNSTNPVLGVSGVHFGIGLCMQTCANLCVCPSKHKISVNVIGRARILFSVLAQSLNDDHYSQSRLNISYCLHTFLLLKCTIVFKWNTEELILGWIQTEKKKHSRDIWQLSHAVDFVYCKGKYHTWSAWHSDKECLVKWWKLFIICFSCIQ